MEGFSLFSNIISVIVTAIVTWAGTFLFYRQKRDSLDIENEARRSEEWRKLYLESQKDSRDKDRKIDELRRSMRDMQSQIISLEYRVRINTIYRCEDVACINRRPPIQPDPQHFPTGSSSYPSHTDPSVSGQPGLADTPADTESSDDLDR